VASLQTLAMGLVIVFLDVGPSGWDWVADPVGWVVVLIGLAGVREVLVSYRALSVTAWICLGISLLTYSPTSVRTLDPMLGWLFSLPTVAFCFLCCDALMDVTTDPMRNRFDVLRWSFVVVGALPLLLYGAGMDWLTIPTAVVAVVVNVALLFALWAAGEQDPPVVEEPARENQDS
jgi:hypothetical protein